MNKILVPIDFSQCALDAFLYAKEIASVLNLSLQVVNVYQPSYVLNNKTLLEPGKGKDQTVNKKIQKFIKTIPQQTNKSIPSIKIETSAVLGVSVVDTLVEMSQDPTITMIVMGTQDYHSTIQKILGSVSSALAQKAHCPVILVPEAAKFKSLNNILYASNYESTDEDMLKQVIDFTQLFQAAPHFVHIEEKDNYELVKNTVFAKLFEPNNPSFSFNVINIEAQDIPVIDALYQYAESNQIDLIVLVNRQRSFIENIFKQSLTQKMALNPKFPLMVFHLMND